MAITLTKELRRTFVTDRGEYLVKLKPQHIFDVIEIHLRRPGARLFKYRLAATEILPITAAQAEKMEGLQMDKPDSLVRLADFAIRQYEKSVDAMAAAADWAETQANVFNQN